MPDLEHEFLDIVEPILRASGITPLTVGYATWNRAAHNLAAEMQRRVEQERAAIVNTLAGSVPAGKGKYLIVEEDHENR